MYAMLIILIATFVFLRTQRQAPSAQRQAPSAQRQAPSAQRHLPVYSAEQLRQARRDRRIITW